jgi:tRNA nucleotidyltransferase/poly(A) polymerase
VEQRDLIKADENFQRARLILRILIDHGYPSRLVGGCVRDRFLGIPPKDYDIATSARPEEVQEVFKNHRTPPITVVPTGLAHGTLTLVLDHHPFEVTTLRQDVETDGRRAKVSFDTCFRSDAARRDFTMNALSEDIDGVVYDYFSGREHLKQNKIVFIGSPEQRIAEDYLRILRYYRFKARFNLSGDAATARTIAAMADGLRKISKERITSELWGLLQTNHVAVNLTEMAEAGLFKVILPELAPVLTKQGIARISELLQHVPSSEPALRPLAYVSTWALMRGDDSLQWLSNDLKISNKQQHCISWSAQGFKRLPDLSLDQATLCDFLDQGDKNCGKQTFSTYLLPLWRDLCPLYTGGKRQNAEKRLQQLAFVETHKSHVRLSFPISGRDVTRWTGLQAGPKVGEILLQLKIAYRNEQWTSKEEAKTLARTLAASE